MTDQSRDRFRISVGGDVSGQFVTGRGNNVVSTCAVPMGPVSRTSSRSTAAHHQPVHYSIMAIDVAASGGRDDQLQLRMRADLREIVAAALARQPQDMHAVDRTDLGDGVRLIVPASIAPRSLLDPFVPNLDSALREHSKAVIAAARLRLRLAVHMGLLHRDEDGWAGQPLVHCARLLNAETTRQVLDIAKRAHPGSCGVPSSVRGGSAPRIRTRPGQLPTNHRQRKGNSGNRVDPYPGVPRAARGRRQLAVNGRPCTGAFTTNIVEARERRCLDWPLAKASHEQHGYLPGDRWWRFRPGDRRRPQCSHQRQLRFYR